MVITIAMQKGGVGKSTTTAALTQAAADAGKRVLAIDLDSQGNTSFFLAADATRPGAYELLTSAADPRRLIQTTQGGIDVIPASWNLATITSSRGSARRLQRAIEPIKRSYDFIFIDTPPAVGELQYNALQAADRLVIPLQCDIVGLQGLYLIYDTAQQIAASNPGLKIAGIVLTRHNSRSTIARQMAEKITSTAAKMGIPYLGTIREAVAVREAQTLQRSLYEYAPNSNPARDYEAVLQQLIGG